MARFAAIAFLLLVSMVAATRVAFSFETSSQPLSIATANGPVEFTIELAVTPEERSQGLMHRETMDADHGMLFVFDQTRPVSMWMKNTILPLDMLFIDETGEIAGIAANTVPFSESIVSAPRPVRYVLELNAGVAAKKGIAPGDRVSHPALTIAEN
jgi:Uncharacterized conserved protein